MAEKKSPSKTKKTKTTAKTRTTANTADNNAKSQVSAVLLFALSALLMCIAIIKGKSVWNFLHNFFLGLLGIWGYILPLLLAACAILIALNKAKSVKSKIIETLLLIWMAASLHDVLITSDTAATYWKHIAVNYKLGFKGPGLFGSLLGYPILSFGKAAAIAIFVILIFVFVMLITGTTLIALFKTASKPIKKIEDAAEKAYAERAERVAEKNAQKTHETQPRFNVDVAIDDEEERGKKEAELKAKKKRLIDAYNGVSSDDADADEAPDVKQDANENDSVDISTVIMNKINEESEKQTEPFTPPADLEDKADDGEKPEYVFPPITQLAPPVVNNKGVVASELENTASLLVNTLRSFGVETRIINISRGPAVTRYELQPSAGVKISKITNLADDIALNLAAAGVRIEAPIPNKAAVGIEVPNKSVSMVRIREVIDSDTFKKAKSKLTVALGKDIAGEVTVADISKMPHGLIAGTTGSGKSVCINSIIISLLYKASPDEVKFLLIDPKQVELGVYNGIPHLLVPVVTDPRKAAGALGWAVTEMEKRYKEFAENEVRNIDGYNKLAEKREDLAKMPHIVIIIDELADLMMTAAHEVEDYICRIAQKARAAGMHLIVATQRPTVDVVTGLIKANIPSRIAFAVKSQIDSRTILDVGGADKLLGRGDMLYLPLGASKPCRVQGCFVTDQEIENIIDFIKSSGRKHEYDQNIIVEIEHQAAKEKAATTGLPEDAVSDYDPMIEDAIRVVVDAGQASTSLLQRKLKLGYSRAARIMDQMEERGAIGPYEGAKPRKVLISREELSGSYDDITESEE